MRDSPVPPFCEGTLALPDLALSLPAGDQSIWYSKLNRMSSLLARLRCRQTVHRHLGVRTKILLGRLDKMNRCIGKRLIRLPLEASCFRVILASWAICKPRVYTACTVGYRRGDIELSR